MPLGPPEKLTIGEHLPAKESSVLGVTDARVPSASDSTVTPSFYSILDFWLSCKHHISSSGDPKMVKPILWYALRWLVFNKNIK